MAFGREIFQQFCAALHTRAEDLELSLQLAAAQVSVSFVPDAVVFDPKPTDMQAATRQRARWLQGHWEVVRHYWREILQVLSRGSLGERALVISLLLRPRTLLMCLKALFLLSSLLLFFSSLSHLALFVSTGAAFALGADVVYYLLGSSLVTNPKAIQTLKRFTVYLPVWIGAVILSVFSGERWLRVRRKAAGQ
jgi:cellulose synthase/poly-beta-1,6-N-acetylglucosamine synthase-like glycosyltransferase